MVFRLQVMLAQEIEPVIVSVRGPDDGVHMELLRFGIGQEHAGVVVEFDEYDRALDAVVEGRIPILLL